MAAVELFWILEKAYARLEPYIKELGELLSREMGKDFRRATGEVGNVVYWGTFIARVAMEALKARDLGNGTQVEYAVESV